ncbi:hypothetical protein RBSH_03338 [Rhodopirellula baltica SH28]|uniref:Uncharacterized protein n=1 Tax=Rhodopirellula baltica SH28 TaxID=993517 RepID=K5E689_RHOBT|nr:hypothetical protein RBSH_03338 [Rhodopirellula baltica SH28]
MYLVALARDCRTSVCEGVSWALMFPIPIGRRIIQTIADAIETQLRLLKQRIGESLGRY